MHPTVDEQLRGALRLLDLLAASIPVSVEASEVLANVRRLVGQAQRAAVSASAFHREDNATLSALLERTGAGAQDLMTGGADDAAVAQRNVDLRGRLCQVIEQLPADVRGDAARDEIGRHLLRRVEHDPV